ncbi:conserved hypothetical protein [Vibrio crassostreae]|nr:conserved hypothetical protein [Vibrio crassostreae]
MQLTDTQKLEYIKTGFNKCPMCSSTDFDVNTPDGSHVTYSHESDCNHCFGTWQDEFSLSDIELIKGGKLEIKQLNKLQKERYLSHGHACPVCQYNNEDGKGLGLNCDEFQPDGNTGSMLVDCPCCKSEWQEIYNLTDVEVLDGGKYAREESNEDVSDAE